MASAALHNVQDQLASDGGAKSSGTFPGRLPVENSRPALDPHGMHREFPEVWKRYLAEIYGNRRGAIMEAFAVDDRTVRAWINGYNAPRGHIVATAAARNPEFFAAIEVAA